MNDQTQFISRLEYSVLDTEYFNIFMNSDFFLPVWKWQHQGKKNFLSYVITVFMACIYREYYLILSSILVRFRFTFPGIF